MATVIRKDMDLTKLYESYRLKLEWVREVCAGGSFNEIEADNFEDSDTRSAKAFADMCRSKDEIKENCSRFLKSFGIDNDGEHKLGMVTQSIKEGVVGLCPHHLLPVNYEVFVSYIPQEGKDCRVLGLSKLTRLAREIPKFPMLQEEYAKNLADVLYEGNEWLDGINSAGSAVMVIGRHGCMACRGVLSNGLTASCEVRGCYENETLEQRFYTQVAQIRNSVFGM